MSPTIPPIPPKRRGRKRRRSHSSGHRPASQADLREASSTRTFECVNCRAIETEKEPLMAGISRRDFFKKAGADAAAVGILAVTADKLYANPLGLPIGSQTYPHRQMIVDGKFPELLKTLKDIGVER